MFQYVTTWEDFLLGAVPWARDGKLCGWNLDSLISRGGEGVCEGQEVELADSRTWMVLLLRSNTQWGLEVNKWPERKGPQGNENEPRMTGMVNPTSPAMPFPTQTVHDHEGMGSHSVLNMVVLSQFRLNYKLRFHSLNSSELSKCSCLISKGNGWQLSSLEYLLTANIYIWRNATQLITQSLASQEIVHLAIPE